MDGGASAEVGACGIVTARGVPANALPGVIATAQSTARTPCRIFRMNIGAACEVIAPCLRPVAATQIPASHDVTSASSSPPFPRRLTRCRAASPSVPDLPAVPSDDAIARDRLCACTLASIHWQGAGTRSRHVVTACEPPESRSVQGRADVNLMKAVAGLASVAVVCAPVQARADGFVNPWIGINVADATDEGHRTLGVTAGYMAAGVFGFEADFGYSPRFVDTRFESGNGYAFTVMGNAIAGVPIGGTHGGGVRPFVSGGFGFVRRHSDGGAIVERSRWSNGFAYDLGFGMMGFFNQHVGLRGDARYIRGLKDTDWGSGVDLEAGPLRYWRVSAGVTF